MRSLICKFSTFFSLAKISVSGEKMKTFFSPEKNFVFDFHYSFFIAVFPIQAILDFKGLFLKLLSGFSVIQDFRTMKTYLVTNAFLKEKNQF